MKKEMFFEEKLAQIDSILKECDFSERILLWGGENTHVN